MTSSNLQTMRMSIRGHRVEDISVFILVQTHLQRGDLPVLDYVNAEKRAEATVTLFRDVIKIAPEKIKIIKNATKAELLALFKEIKDDAKRHEDENKDKPHSLKSFFFSCIGFQLDSQYHPYLKDFDIRR